VQMMFRVYPNLNNHAPEIAAINLGQWHPHEIHKPLHFAMESHSLEGGDGQVERWREEGVGVKVERGVDFTKPR